MMRPLELSNLHLPLTNLCQIHPDSILECFRVIYPTSTNSNRVSITFDFVKPEPLLQLSSKTISLSNSMNRHVFSSKRARKTQARAAEYPKTPQPPVIPTSAGNSESFNRHSSSPLSTTSSPIIPVSNESLDRVSSHAEIQISNTSLPASQGETKSSQQPNSIKTNSSALTPSSITSNNNLASSQSISSTIGTGGGSSSGSSSAAVSAVSAATPSVVFDFFAPVNDDGGSRQDSFSANQSSLPSEQLPSADSSAFSVAQHASSFVDGRRRHRSKHRRLEGGHVSVPASQSSSSYAHPNPYELLSSSTDSSLVLTQASSSSSPTPAESITIPPSDPFEKLMSLVRSFSSLSTSHGLAPLPRRSHEQRTASTSALSSVRRSGGHRGNRPPDPPSSVQLPDENRKSIAH